jgi:hypothetical protein
MRKASPQSKAYHKREIDTIRRMSSSHVQRQRYLDAFLREIDTASQEDNTLVNLFDVGTFFNEDELPDV